jgi:hypothetical protein
MATFTWNTTKERKELNDMIDAACHCMTNKSDDTDSQSSDSLDFMESTIETTNLPVIENINDMDLILDTVTFDFNTIQYEDFSSDSESSDSTFGLLINQIMIKSEIMFGKKYRQVSYDSKNEIKINMLPDDNTTIEEKNGSESGCY